MIVFSHIMVAWDGSENATRALDYGAEIALRFKARLQIVSVARPAEHADTESERRSSTGDARRFFEERSAPAIEAAKKRGIAVEAIVVEGSHPAESIVDTAHQLGVDLIVVGRRGRSGFTRFLMGSITDRIARYAQCPILIVDER